MNINQSLPALVAVGLLSLTTGVACAGLRLSASPTPLAPPRDHPSVLVHHTTDDQGGNTSLRFMANRKVDESSGLSFQYPSHKARPASCGYAWAFKIKVR